MVKFDHAYWAKTSALGLLAVIACGAPDPISRFDAPQMAEALDHAPFSRCSPNALGPTVREPFEDAEHDTLSHHTPHHAAQDIIARPGQSADVIAWFDYGLRMQPMAHERVRLYSAACQPASPMDPVAWRLEGATDTDAHGQVRVALQLPAQDKVRRVRLLFEMLGDGTRAQSDVWILPKGTPLVVFDIDGTLSINNRSFMREIAEHMVGLTFWPEAFDGAQALTHLWQAKGYMPVYLTNRPHQLADLTRDWLTLKGFAEGPVLVSELFYDLIPNEDGAGAYKRAILTKLAAEGYPLGFAYGNEPTDIFAYTQAGIAPERIFSIGTHAGIGNTVALDQSYLTHMQDVAALPSHDALYSMDLTAQYRCFPADMK